MRVWISRPCRMEMMEGWAIAVALLFAGCTGAAGQNAPETGAVARGRAQFTKTCSFCHGADATGGPEGPNLTLSTTVRHDVNGNLIGTVIREGRPAKGMPPIPLQPDQIADVVAYLHARVTELDRRSAGKPPSSYGLEHLLTGDAAKGKAFFDGVGHCTQCHSVTGDLGGIAKKYPPVELQARFLYPPEVEQTATVTPSTGPAVQGVVVYEDAFTISLRDREGWYHSWPLSTVGVELKDPLVGHRELLGHYTEADMHNVFAYLETLK